MTENKPDLLIFLLHSESGGERRGERRGAKSEGVIHSCPTASSVRSASP